jgi:hypothetical protein
MGAGCLWGDAGRIGKLGCCKCPPVQEGVSIIALAGSPTRLAISAIKGAVWIVDSTTIGLTGPWDKHFGRHRNE